ncbi:RHS repeat-associated core domain-containing protein, partial [Herbaspirillum sp. GCM10030257]|uniref:RHS repeat-associated core domain-containing protein n=1 Tax=Herbaspirillum sp. GCM10030257 TaxID=3273393 RepID=UPI003610F744
DAFVPIAQVDSTTATSAPHAAQAQKSQNVRYIHTDHLGTPRELTSGSGEIVWAGVHKAWGNLAIAAMPAVQVADDQDTAAEPSAFTDVMPLRFQGQYYDSETGLHYNRFRYYDPDSGRFVSQDPIGLQGGNNLYQYAPNPTAWIDPLGLATCKCGSTQLTFDKKSHTWTTPAGLDYGLGSVHRNRIKHILDHAVPNPSKTTHSVFNVERKEILGLVDEAWSTKGKPLANDPGAYIVPMGRVIGTAGERNLKIIVRPGTNQIITAYAVH